MQVREFIDGLWEVSTGFEPELGRSDVLEYKRRLSRAELGRFNQVASATICTSYVIFCYLQKARTAEEYDALLDSGVRGSGLYDDVMRAFEEEMAMPSMGRIYEEVRASIGRFLESIPGEEDDGGVGSIDSADSTPVEPVESFPLARLSDVTPIDFNLPEEIGPVPMPDFEIRLRNFMSFLERGGYTYLNRLIEDWHTDYYRFVMYRIFRDTDYNSVKGKKREHNCDLTDAWPRLPSAPCVLYMRHMCLKRQQEFPKNSRDFDIFLGFLAQFNPK